MGIEAPPRAQYIRTILTELSAASRRSYLFLGEMGLQVGALTPAFYGLPRPRARPQPHRGRDRRALPPQLQPHRRAEGRPPVGLDQRDPHRDEDDPRRAATTFEDLVAGNEIFEARTRSIGIIPAELGAAYGVSGSNLRGVGRRLGPPPRRQAVPRRTPSSTSRSGPTPTATRSPATGCGCRRRASRRGWCCRCSTSCPSGPDHGEGARASSRCPRARSGSRPRTRSARWATTSSRRARPARSG